MMEKKSAWALRLFSLGLLCVNGYVSGMDSDDFDEVIEQDNVATAFAQVLEENGGDIAKTYNDLSTSSILPEELKNATGFTATQMVEIEALVDKYNGGFYDVITMVNNDNDDRAENNAIITAMVAVRNAQYKLEQDLLDGDENAWGNFINTANLNNIHTLRNGYRDGTDLLDLTDVATTHALDANHKALPATHNGNAGTYVTAISTAATVEDIFLCFENMSLDATAAGITNKMKVAGGAAMHGAVAADIEMARLAYWYNLAYFMQNGQFCNAVAWAPSGGAPKVFTQDELKDLRLKYNYRALKLMIKWSRQH